MDSFTISSSSWCINPKAVIAIYNLSQAGHKIISTTSPTFAITNKVSRGNCIYHLLMSSPKKEIDEESFHGHILSRESRMTVMDGCCRDFATILSLISKKWKNWNDFWYIIIQLHIRRSKLVSSSLPIPSNLPQPPLQPIAGTLILIIERPLGFANHHQTRPMKSCRSPSGQLFCIWYSLFAISWRKSASILLQRSFCVNSVDFALRPARDFLR